jgi:iron complex transport system ATP-binding protein
VTRALEVTDTIDLADRVVDELSGGQRQRVWIAMALAQETDLLLLDEPTTYLDVAHQVEVLDLLRDLNAARGTTIVMVLHELNLAGRYADHLVAMRDGRVSASGAPADVITREGVREVFGMDCHVISDPVSHTPMVVPIGRHAPASTTPRPGGTP